MDLRPATHSSWCVVTYLQTSVLHPTADYLVQSADYDLLKSAQLAFCAPWWHPSVKRLQLGTKALEGWVGGGWTKKQQKITPSRLFPVVAWDCQTLGGCVYASGWQVPLAPCEIRDCVAGSESAARACAKQEPSALTAWATSGEGGVTRRRKKIPPCLCIFSLIIIWHVPTLA